MVDERPVSLAHSRKQGADAVDKYQGPECHGIMSEPECGLLNGCAWCLQIAAPSPSGTRAHAGLAAKGGSKRDAGGSMRRRAAARSLLDDDAQAAGQDTRVCSPWMQCTAPESLCEIRRSESACSGDGAAESSCVWCTSEARCVSMPAKGLEASKNGQCKGCDGVFDSGIRKDSCGVCGGSGVPCTSGHKFAFTRQEKIGIILALCGNVLISVSLNTQKYAHNENEKRSAGKVSYLRLKMWWVGMLLMALGETGNFLAYAYAPATVVAPLGAVSVISNCFLAHFVLKEHIGLRNLLGVFLAILGSVIIVTYAPSSDRQLTMDLLVRCLTET
jgi:uncharacterized membrane protein